MIIRIDISFGVYFKIFYTSIPEFIIEAIAAPKVRKALTASGWCWQVIG
jgi:hypothetical protein